MLDRQVGTLAELCAGAGVITRADVERYVTRIAEVKPWDFLDAVCARDAGRALELYGLMQNPSEIALVSMLVGRLEIFPLAVMLRPGFWRKETGWD